MKLSSKLICLGIASVTVLSSCNTTIGLARDMRVLGSEMEKKADQTYNGTSGSEYSEEGYTEDQYSGGAPVY